MKNVENPIAEVIDYGWSKDLKKFNKTAINMLAENFLPFLVELAEKIQLESDTKYSTEELVNFGYIGLVELILEQPSKVIDSGEIKDRTIGFMMKIIEAEAEVAEELELFECPEEDCLGKECRLHHCYAFTGEISLDHLKLARGHISKIKRPRAKTFELKSKKTR